MVSMGGSMRAHPLPTLVILAAICQLFSGLTTVQAEEGVVNLDQVRLTVLFDNVEPREEGLTAEWGFSCLVETGEHRFLFDTGSGDAVRENMRQLGVDPASLEAVVISHNHWDHIGGLPSLLEELGDVPVVLPKPPDAKMHAELETWGGEVRIVKYGFELFPGVHLTDVLPAREPERSLVIVTGEGSLIVAGCSHPGVQEILGEARKIADQKPLLFIGGYHLGSSPDGDVHDVIDAFREHEIAYIVPTHCTGDRATELFRKAFGDHCLRGGAGLVIKGTELRNGS